MNIKLLAGVAAAAVMAGSGASAQVLGWYAAGDLGYHWPEEQSFALPGIAGGSLNIENEEDWAAFVRIGYRFTPHWRGELEGGYRVSNGVDLTAGAPITGEVADSKTTTIMANVIYDILPDSTINPFVGVGVGGLKQNFSFNGASATTNYAGADDDEWTVAYQGILGVAWNASERLSFDLTYRYLMAPDVSTNVTRQALTVAGTTAFNSREDDYVDQSISVGLRFALSDPRAAAASAAPAASAPAASPPPPPVAYEAREFIVYFPFDQYILTPEAQTVIQQASDYAKAGNATQIVVVGHADTSGSAAYNVRLSERRAKAVADALVGTGVAQTALSVDWKGESQPAVATGDGVKEPLNRRATIGINF